MTVHSHTIPSRIAHTIILCALFVSPLSAFAFQPNDPQWSEANGISMLHLPDAWDKTQGSSDVIVAVIDTGVDILNPDISQNIWSNPGEKLDGLDNDNDGYIDDLNGWNFVDNNSNVRPDPSVTSSTRIGINHGTVVAGIIGAEGNNFLGGAGVAWHVKIMPLKILNERGDGDSDLAVKAIDYAIAHKAQIINLSFVGPTPSLNFIQAIRRAYRAGITVIAAAGNAPEHAAGTNLNLEPQYPVCFDDPLKEENWVIGVAALNDIGTLAPFSNYGSKCVDISAPGFRISSTLFFDPTHGFSDIYGGTWSGTSIAAPFVTGVAALVKSIQPNWGPNEIRQALVDTSDPIPGNGDLSAGRGSLNAAKAVQYAIHGGAAPDTSAVAGIVYNKKGASLVVQNESLDEQRRILFAPGKITTAQALSADIDGSGATPFIVAYNDAKGPIIKFLQQNGTLITTIRPFGPKVRGAVHITAADLNRDGSSEIIAVADNNPTMVIIGGDGKIRRALPLIDAKGVLGITSYFRAGAEYIVTTVTHKNDITAYAWNDIGAFVSSFQVPTQKGVNYSFGSAPQMNGSDDALFVSATTGQNILITYYDIFGKLLTTYSPAIPDGKLIGISFAHIGDALRLTATSQIDNSLELSIFDAHGLINYVLRRDIVKGDRFDPFIFAQ